MDEALPFRRHSLISYRNLMFTAALIVCVVMISFVAAADDSDAQFTVDGINYEPTSDSTVSVVESDCSGSIVIPASVENGGKTYAVTSIGDKAFSDRSDLISVELPEGLQSIGKCSFSCCRSLRTINIPDSVTAIKWEAFWCCESLTVMNLGKNVHFVSDDSFSGATSLEAFTVHDENDHYRSVDGVLFSKDMTRLVCYPAGKAGESYTTPSGIKSLGYDSFYKCQYLKDVTVSEGAETMSSSFNYCSALTTVSLPDSLKSVIDSSFDMCPSLISVTFGTGVEEIGDFCFYECKSLERITVPAGNQYYSSENGVLFDHDKTVLIKYPSNRDSESYSIPDTVRTLKLYAFEHCSKLKTVVIPDGVCTIEHSNFSDCEKLETVSFPDSVESLGGNAFSECKLLRSIHISEKLTEISPGSFWNCSSLESITLPNSISSVGDNCFYSCTSLKSVVIPDGTVALGESVFNNCDSLETVNLGKGLTAVGPSSFRNCKSLREIDIQGKDTSLGEGVFAECSALERVNVTADNINYCSDDGVLLDKARTVILLYPAARVGTSYTVPDTVKSIGTGIFSYCKTLETIVIPDSVGTIGKEAFRGCTKLKEVDLPGILTIIDDYTFCDCSSLVQIDIPRTVTAIGEHAFYRCESIVSVSIPEGVTSLGEGAFSACSEMTAITVSPENANYSSDDGVLFDKNKTVLLQYPEGKTDTSYSIPEGVVSAADDSLDSKKLTSITIPATFTQKFTSSIGYLYKLKEINVSADNPLFASKDGVLFNKDITTLITVPMGYPHNTYYIPDTVVTIEGKIDGWAVNSLVIPASVRNISENALSSFTKNIYLRSCHLESCYPMNTTLSLIGIDAGTTGADVLFANYTFATTDGKTIDKSDLAGHTYRNEDGVMVMVIESADDEGFNYWLLLIPAIIIIVVADILITKRRH